MVAPMTGLGEQSIRQMKSLVLPGITSVLVMRFGSPSCG
jgi:hypothetical protein